MNVSAGRDAERRRRIVLLLPAVILSVVGVCQSILGADDARLQPGGIDEKRFLQRLMDAGNMDVKTRIDALQKRAVGAELRQFQWDALDRQPRNARDAKPVGAMRPVAVPVQQVEVINLPPRLLMVFNDGDVKVLVETVPPLENPDEEVEPGDAQFPTQRFRIAEASCDQMLFGKGKNAVEARRQLDEQLQSNIASIDRVCELSPSQAEKLWLAGRGDIHRFFERAGEMRMKIDAAGEGDAGDQRAMMNRVLALSRESKALRQALGANIFGAGSLFAKALRKVLTPAQAARHTPSAPPASGNK